MDITRFCFVEIVTFLWGVIVPGYVRLIVMYMTYTEKQTKAFGFRCLV